SLIRRIRRWRSAWSACQRSRRAVSQDGVRRLTLVPRDLVAAHGPAFGAALLLDDPHVARTAHLERAPMPSDNGETVGNAERLRVERGELARLGAGRLVLAAARVVVRA